MTTTSNNSTSLTAGPRWSLRSLSTQELRAELSHVRYRLSPDDTVPAYRLRPLTPQVRAELKRREEAILAELRFRQELSTRA